MYTVLLASLVSLAAAQSAASADAVSQIGDGQAQVPTAPGPEIPEASVPSVSTSAPYENPFTVYTAETNSWGVITGMPSVVTSQPLAVTSQPTQPAVVTSQPVSPVHSYANTTLQTSTSASETASESETETASASNTASSSPSVAPINESGAETSRIAGACIALVVVSVGFFML